MVEEDQPQREAAEQIEPQVASGADHGGVHSGDLFVGDGRRQTLVNRPGRLGSRQRDICKRWTYGYSLCSEHTRQSARNGAEGLAMNAVKPAYRAVTREIEVKVTPALPARPLLAGERLFLLGLYHHITNLGTETVQLKTRHWRITDAQGRLQEVRGAGRGGRGAGAQAGRVLRIHQRRAAADAVRLHGRHLRHGDRGGRGVRHRHPGLLARHAAARAARSIRAVPRLRRAGLQPARRPRSAPRGEGATDGSGVMHVHPARTHKSNCKIRRSP